LRRLSLSSLRRSSNAACIDANVGCELSDGSIVHAAHLRRTRAQAGEHWARSAAYSLPAMAAQHGPGQLRSQASTWRFPGPHQPRPWPFGYAGRTGTRSVGGGDRGQTVPSPHNTGWGSVGLALAGSDRCGSERAFSSPTRSGSSRLTSRVL